ncbi:enolase C-terminal domain-like protein [Streptomyces sp. NPDC007861]|uniref:enolase C-terminal domain-like protein n=1 Tax=Streptomyces sp. NPDC007861 TaxID=3154893 RepID=UPI00340D18B3
MVDAFGALPIADVRLTPVLVADPPLLNAHGVHQPFTPRLIIEVVTRDGIAGVGETYGDSRYLRLARLLGEVLPGHGFTGVNGLEALSALVTREPNGRPGPDDRLWPSVLSGFEVACMDALGKSVDLPVHALLGGKVRDSVEYSAYLFYRWAEHPGRTGSQDDWGSALTPGGIVEQARRFVREHGFASFKLKGGVFPPDQEIAAIRALAEAFPGHPLRLDPNTAWSEATSLYVADSLDGVLEYLEDPVASTGAMAKVAAATDVPLATNMCVTGFSEIAAAFASDAVQVVLSDHHYWGGLMRTRDLAAICRTFGVGLSMHSNTHLGISLAAMTQVAATVPNLDHACDTHYPWQTEDVITERHVFRDGRLTVSDAPGLGVELDTDRLAVLHRRWLEDDGTMRDRDDVAAMRVADPDWPTPAMPRW